MDTPINVIDEGDDRTYRIEIPNLIDDYDLSVHAVRLYLHLKRRAGDRGCCFEGARKMAAHCRMSLGMIVKAKHELRDKKLIRIVPGDMQTSTSDTIFITNIWKQNLERYQTPCSPNEHPPCSYYEHPCS